ncbi:MAG: hypothetical protein COT17_07955 [Elusimicrobia bacterium CG08_land_8_20_14_0_20_51_18]|nr:MAG: hypothetical protein COT17_07955 [Elusimicrobia bacterium CG08_land_8_20_14_0_20_51_18]
MKGFEKESKKFSELLGIIRKLLGPGGCPWDREQSHKSLLKYLREESGEFARAVRKRDYGNMKEELGDILLQVALHSELARKGKKFDIGGVLSVLNRKLIRRHPHVFGKSRAKNAGDVVKQWNKIKKREKKRRKTRGVDA